ncbi:hypothetical protein HN789_05095 [archaeon]|jgi:hypothetical protein|nr:hypothetical protein [archaeon]MBT4022888.1 hypothetical protein [archaeon]MBT4272535.1 hypothetical protein [archaeon]MBT4460397.1 hypothetical protein [archaeon]MBT4859028.1 hypothetical protein [archaeon]
MKKYTKEQLIFYLKKYSKELKKTPTIKDINKNKKVPSSSTYMKRFGSWNNSLKKAGLKINIVKKFEKKELTENLKQLKKELGRIPKLSDLKERKWIASSSTYVKYFGSFKKALKAAGLKQSEIISLKRYSKK